MMMGDDDSTVTASTHDKMEAEANYAAGSLLFLGDRFRDECHSLDPPTIIKAQKLKKAFGNTLTSTFWRMIEYAGEDRPMLGFVDFHPRSEQSYTSAAFRHLILSPAFSRAFPTPDVVKIGDQIRGYCGWQRKGPLGGDIVLLRDHDGARHEFSIETFFNGYDALTLAVWKQQLPTTIAVNPW